jgi:hypothetical protein
MQPPDAGAWIVDWDGSYRPDPNDPAMVERYGLKKEETKEVKSHGRNAEKQSPAPGKD